MELLKKDCRLCVGFAGEEGERVAPKSAKPRAKLSESFGRDSFSRDFWTELELRRVSLKRQWLEHVGLLGEKKGKNIQENDQENKHENDQENDEERKKYEKKKKYEKMKKYEKKYETKYETIYGKKNEENEEKILQRNIKNGGQKMSVDISKFDDIYEIGENIDSQPTNIGISHIEPLPEVDNSSLRAENAFRAFAGAKFQCASQEGSFILKHGMTLQSDYLEDFARDLTQGFLSLPTRLHGYSPIPKEAPLDRLTRLRQEVPESVAAAREWLASSAQDEMEEPTAEWVDSANTRCADLFREAKGQLDQVLISEECIVGRGMKEQPSIWDPARGDDLLTLEDLVVNFDKNREGSSTMSMNVAATRRTSPGLYLAHAELNHLQNRLSRLASIVGTSKSNRTVTERLEEVEKNLSFCEDEFLMDKFEASYMVMRRQLEELNNIDDTRSSSQGALSIPDEWKVETQIRKLYELAAPLDSYIPEEEESAAQIAVMQKKFRFFNCVAEVCNKTEEDQESAASLSRSCEQAQKKVEQRSEEWEIIFKKMADRIDRLEKKSNPPI